MMGRSYEGVPCCSILEVCVVLFALICGKISGEKVSCAAAVLSWVELLFQDRNPLRLPFQEGVLSKCVESSF